MGNAGSVQLARLVAKLLGKKFPSKKGTIILLVCWFAFVFVIISILIIQTVEYYGGEVAEYSYLYCDGFNLVTETRTIHIAPNNATDREKICKAFSTVSPDDRLRVRTSAYTNEVIEVYRDDQLIYQSVYPQISAIVFTALVMLPPGIMLIVIINMKHPSKRWRKIQREFIG